MTWRFVLIGNCMIIIMYSRHVHIHWRTEVKKQCTLEKYSTAHWGTNLESHEYYEWINPFSGCCTVLDRKVFNNTRCSNQSNPSKWIAVSILTLVSNYQLWDPLFHFWLSSLCTQNWKYYEKQLGNATLVFSEHVPYIIDIYLHVIAYKAKRNKVPLWQ